MSGAPLALAAWMLALAGEAAAVCSFIQPAIPTAQLLDNGDSTITDSASRLMWMRCSEGQLKDDSCSGDATLNTWQAALNIPADLNMSGGHAGFTDWRLPNIKELTSLVEEACYSPAVNTERFPSTPGDGGQDGSGPEQTAGVFWSSSVAYDTGQIGSLRLLQAYSVAFDDGSAQVRSRDESAFVRLVRFRYNDPVADAGMDQSARATDLVTLNGSQSTDSDGTVVSYSWVQKMGTQVQLSDATAVSPTFVAPDPLLPPETLSFELTVTDNDGLTDTDTVDITLTDANLPPTAAAGDDRPVTEGDLVMLDGGMSVDLDGTIVAYKWVQTAGSAILLSDDTNVAPTFIAPDPITLPEVFTFELTVTDNEGATGVDSVSITVNRLEIPPMADAGMDATIVEMTLVMLDGGMSTDADGTIVSYRWEQTAGTAVILSDDTAVDPTFTAPVPLMPPELLTFRLTVTDNDGLTGTDDITLTLVLANLPPMANAAGDQDVLELDTVTLDGMMSNDPDGMIVTYEWTQTAGTIVMLSDITVEAPTFTAPAPALDPETLTFQLKVTDDDGATNTDTVDIVVNELLVAGGQVMNDLNDTGAVRGGIFPTGINSGCTGETIMEQDCSKGRDPLVSDNSDGSAGFNFTKIDAAGNELPSTANSWACVLDNATGLYWEVKTTDGGIHDASNTYQWGGKGAIVTPTSGVQRSTEWNVLVDGSNTENLCGFNNWRVPTVKELISIVNYNRSNPAIDTTYFPNTASANYWTALEGAYYGDCCARFVVFSRGSSSYSNANEFSMQRLRLVRGRK
jgi:hypothetical protein